MSFRTKLQTGDNFLSPYNYYRKKKKIGDFLFQLILYGFTYGVDYTPIQEMNIELGRISRNINQISKRVNASNTVYKEDFRIIQEQLEKI